MIIVLSPAKTLDYSVDPKSNHTAPQFLSQSSSLIKTLKEKEPKDIASLMGLSDKLATLNFDRYQSWKAAKTVSKDAKPSMLVFKGDVVNNLVVERDHIGGVGLALSALIDADDVDVGRNRILVPTGEHLAGDGGKLHPSGPNLVEEPVHPPPHQPQRHRRTDHDEFGPKRRQHHTSNQRDAEQDPQHSNARPHEVCNMQLSRELL